MKLAHNTWVVIADGEKYILLRNNGDEDILDLKVVEHELSKNPEARELASDRPGRRQDSVRTGPGGAHTWGRSAMEETDWHRVAERDFAEGLAVRLRQFLSEKRFTHLVVVADPRTLGALRKTCDEGLRATIVAELGKDLTKVPVERIERTILDFQGAEG